MRSLPVALAIAAAFAAGGCASSRHRASKLTIDAVVAGDGSKAVITAQNNPRIDGGDVPERLYCS